MPSELAWYRQPATATNLWAEIVIRDTRYPPTVVGPMSLDVADMDADGDLDIVSIGWSHGRVLLYENRAR